MTSHWALVVDITFEEFDLQLLQLGEHLQSLKQLIREAQTKGDRNTPVIGSLWK